MINSSFYRGYEIIINVNEGGWFVQQYKKESLTIESVQTLCSQPTQEAARAWIDKHIEENK